MAAAGNGQFLIIKSKTILQFNVRQQVDLVAILCLADCQLQCRVGIAVDLAHSRFCGAAGAVRRVIVLRFLVRQAICCFIAALIRKVMVLQFLVLQFLVLQFLVMALRGGICRRRAICGFIAVLIRRVFHWVRLVGGGICVGLHIRIIRGVGIGGKVIPVQKVVVRIRDGIKICVGVGAQCKHTQRQNTKQQSDGKYHYEPSFFHDFFPPLSKIWCILCTANIVAFDFRKYKRFKRIWNRNHKLFEAAGNRAGVSLGNASCTGVKTCSCAGNSRKS